MIRRASKALLTLAAPLAAGFAGGLALFELNLPAPWLSGGLIGAVALSLAGIPPTMPSALRDLGMLLAGAITGSAISPEMIATIARYPASFVILGITTLAITAVGRWVLWRGFGWDRQSALLAAVPGALSGVIATASAVNANMMRVVTVQSLRMFVLVAMLPSVVLATVEGGGGPAPLAALAPAPFAGMLLAGLIFGLIFERLAFMAPFLLGGMVGAGLLHAADAVSGRVPDSVGSLAMLLVGIFAASRVPSFGGAALKSLILPALSLIVATTGIAVLGGYGASLALHIPIAEALVAYAPGGLDAMVMLGIAMGLDPLYVSSHHIVRFVVISLVLPVLGRRLLR